VETVLAQKGIQLEMSGKNNTVYVSGENAHWDIKQVSDQGDDRGAQAPAGRKSYRNSWGQSLSRQVRGFIQHF
jgi:hypothetical protein